MARDFHTHNPDPVIPALISTDKPMPGKFTSLEYHPWFIPEKYDSSHLPAHHFLQKFSALGEIGLDKIRGIAYPVQQQYLVKLLALAHDCRKPVVIHCVRSFAELFAALKPFSDLKVLFHGFRSSPEMLDELWKRGFTVSFHPQAVNSPALMKKLPHANGAYGFESDDDLQISVTQVIADAETTSGATGVEKITDQYFADFLEI